MEENRAKEIAHLPWFALQVRGRYEKTVATLLRGRGYEPLLPLYVSRRRWSDRVKELELPLFPGYLFCRFDPIHRLPLLTTPGVVQIVSVGRIPAPIDEAEMAAIETAVRTGARSQPWPFLKVGQRVRVSSGPLWGHEGILVECRGHRRIVLAVTVLQRAVAVELDSADVQPVSSSLLPAATSRANHDSEQIPR